MRPIEALVETAIYADDLELAERFYRDVLGLDLTAREEGRLKKNDLVLIASVGAGFTTGAALLRWEI